MEDDFKTFIKGAIILLGVGIGCLGIAMAFHPPAIDEGYAIHALDAYRAHVDAWITQGLLVTLVGAVVARGR